MGAINHSLLSYDLKLQLGRCGFKVLVHTAGRNLAAYPRSLSQGIKFPVLTKVRRVPVCDDPTVSETQSVPVCEFGVCDQVTVFLFVSSLTIVGVVTSLHDRQQQVA